MLHNKNAGGANGRGDRVKAKAGHTTPEDVDPTFYVQNGCGPIKLRRTFLFETNMPVAKRGTTNHISHFISRRAFLTEEMYILFELQRVRIDRNKKHNNMSIGCIVTSLPAPPDAPLHFRALPKTPSEVSALQIRSPDRRSLENKPFEIPVFYRMR